jgi:hypothetical protein
VQAMSVPENGRDMVGDLLAPLPRAAMVPGIQAVLGVTKEKAEKIVDRFDELVSTPLENNLKKLSGRDLAKRNPMIYLARGVDTVEEWVDRVLDDKETSAIEAHLGTWQEDVARIVSDGIKPGAGADLILERDGVTELYAVQTSFNTKNSSSKKAEINALRGAAAALKAQKMSVSMNIGVLNGRKKTAALGSDPNITVVASDEFWERVSGVPDFRARLIKASMILSPLVRKRAADEVARIKAEALALFDDGAGGLNVDAVTNPPKKTSLKKALAPKPTTT